MDEFNDMITKVVSDLKNNIPVLFRYQTMVVLIDALKKELPNAEREYALEIQKMLGDIVDKSSLN